MYRDRERERERKKEREREAGRHRHSYRCRYNCVCVWPLNCNSHTWKWCASEGPCATNHVQWMWILDRNWIISSFSTWVCSNLSTNQPWSSTTLSFGCMSKHYIYTYTYIYVHVYVYISIQYVVLMHLICHPDISIHKTRLVCACPRICVWLS